MLLGPYAHKNKLSPKSDALQLVFNFVEHRVKSDLSSSKRNTRKKMRA